MTLSAAVVLAGIILLGAASPGPDFLLVTRISATSGRLTGFFCAVGIGAGVVGWALAAAVGIASLIAASAVAFTTVKLIGAAYLIFLGIRAMIAGWKSARSRGSGDGPPLASTAPARRTTALGQGFLTNILNPKTAVFFVAMIPQFLPASVSVGSVFVLCAVAAAVVTTWYSLVAVLAGSLTRLFRSSRFRSVLDLASGVTLIGVGVRVATSR